MHADLKLLTPGDFFRRRSRMPLAPYGWASIILVAASSVALAIRPLDEGQVLLLRAAYVGSFLITAVATFRWGRDCGFVVPDREGDGSLTHVLRNSVMTLVMFVGVVLAAAPFTGVAAAFFR